MCTFLRFIEKSDRMKKQSFEETAIQNNITLLFVFFKAILDFCRKV